MFDKLKEVNSRPQPFQYYTAEELWTDEYTAKQMLKYHLDDSIEASSRNRDFIKLSTEWITSRFEVSNKTRIADFGCGPGLYSTLLAEQGALVTGIDFSVISLNYARKVAADKKLPIDYVHANYLDYQASDQFDLIIMIMCDFCALSPDQRSKLLAKFHSMLKPEGSILLDVYSLAYFKKVEEAAIYELNQLNGFWSPDDYYSFKNTFKYLDEKVTLDKYTIIEESRTREIYNWLQCYSQESLMAEFAQNGLRVEELFSDVAGQEFDAESPEIAVVAVKV